MVYAVPLEPDAERERRLVEAARSGREAAWQELFAEHYPELLRFFRSRLGATGRAEDLAAEVFAQAWRSRRRLRWRNRPFAAWLFGIARHELAGEFRRRGREQAVPLDTGEGGLIRTRDEFLAVEVRDLLSRLRPDHRKALELRYVAGLSSIEAAAVMGRSPAGFRALLYRALRAAAEQERS